MQKLLYTLAFIAYLLPATAQKVKFTDTTNEWYDLSTGHLWTGGISIYDSTLTHKKCIGTRLINNTIYTKVVVTKRTKRYTKTSPNIGGYAYDSVATNTFFIRENNNRLYLLETETSTNEQLVFDFNISLGDTVINNGTYAVISVDTITLKGSQHKYYKLKETNTIYEIYKEAIEGIGIVNSSIRLEKSSNKTSILCFKSKGANIYSHPNSPNCKDTTLFKNSNTNSSSNKHQSNNLTIYPQPANGPITIQLPNNSSEIKLYNSLGVNVYTQQLNKKTRIQIEQQPTGIYYYSIITNDNKTYKGKISFL